MSERMVRVNELLRSEIAQAISKENLMDNGLITVTRVNCSANLLNATVFVSVLPENVSGSALKILKNNSSVFNKYLRTLNIKFIPRLNWRIDSQERYAAEMDRFFNEIESQE